MPLAFTRWEPCSLSVAQEEHGQTDVLNISHNALPGPGVGGAWTEKQAAVHLTVDSVLVQALSFVHKDVTLRRVASSFAIPAFRFTGSCGSLRRQAPGDFGRVRSDGHVLPASLQVWKDGTRLKDHVVKGLGREFGEKA